MQTTENPSIRICAAVSAALACGAASAQEPVPGVALQEIVVTAQKREERLIDVPIAVTAVTAADIEARGVTSLQDMQYSVPGLTMAETGPGLGRLQINGIGIAGGSTGLPTVGRYLDEMPITAAAGAGSEIDVRLLDMERVEVLHGPQPTLYGEGSMGGTIHFVTASPDLQRFSGHLQGSWGSVTDGSDSYRASAVVNVPLIQDMLGVRLVAGYERDGGWIDSRVSGARDINPVDLTTVRAKVLFKPRDDLSISLMVLHQNQDQTVQNFGLLDRTSAATYATLNKDRYDLANLVVNFDLGWANLLNSTGFLHRSPESGADFTVFMKPFLPLFGVPPATIATIDSIGSPTVGSHNMLSDELRLSSKASGPFNYVLGAYFRNYRTRSIQNTVTAPGQLPFQMLASDAGYMSRTWAGFAELRYAFSDRLEGLVGLRHFHERQEDVQTGWGVFNTPGTLTDAADFSSNNPRINLSYKTSPDGLVYVNAAKGFRSGQFNMTPAPDVPRTVGPERLFTYEIGTKQQWFERRLSTELSAYYNQWRDIQVLGVSNGAPLGYFDNSGRASGPGVNFMLAARPLSTLTTSVTVGYTDMKYDTTSANRNSGDSLDMVSRWTWSVAADYRRPLGDDRALIARADLAHTSGYKLIIRHYGQEVFPTDTRNVLNLRAGVAFGNYQVVAFADNVTDDNGVIYPVVGSFAEPTLPTPRTVGVELRVDF